MKKNGMRYRPLGRCGTQTSVLSLGGWTTFGNSIKGPEGVRKILHAAHEAGINFFDIADVYAHGEAERAMGKVFRDFPRHTLVIASKLYWPMSEEVNDQGLSRKHIMESAEKSLQRIGTDYLDIYFCHRYDEKTPLEETVRAMDDLVHHGKILYWGTSEWTGGQLKAVHALCERRNLYPPQVEQPQYNLLERKRFETDAAPAAQKLGMGLVVWSPLASGVLTGKYDDGIPVGSRLAQPGLQWLQEKILTEANRKKVRAFKKIADSMGTSRAKLALAWTLAQPGVTSVITGASRPEQLSENLESLSLEIAPEIQKAIGDFFI
jgi:voltage-dependent potassium channel beta subunit